MKKEINVGIVGIGFGRSVHLPVFKAHPRCKVLAVCASSLERARGVAEKENIELAFGDWHDLITCPDIDAISIATPPKVQAKIALEAIKNCKNVFCEKPIAIDIVMAKKLSDAASASNVANMVDFEFHEINEFKKTKELLCNQTIGDVKHVSVSWSIETRVHKLGLDSWKVKAQDGGGVLANFISHVFHYIEWLLGPIKEISAKVPRNVKSINGADTFDVIYARLESGAFVSITASNDSFLGSGHRLEFYGDKGAMILKNSSFDYINGFELFAGLKSEDKLEPVKVDEVDKKELKDTRIYPVGRLVDKFVKWIDGGKKARPDFIDALRVEVLMDAALRSSESDSTIYLDN